MSWDILFSVTNIWALGAWLLLIFLPRKELLLTVILYIGVALLCLTYAISMGLLLSNAVDPGGSSAGPISFSSIEGIRALFATNAGVVIGWIHYLAFDLFIGMWIARDADSKGISRIVQTPVLITTFLMGPVGLLAWLIFREPAARRNAKAKSSVG
jgi:flagellar basal body-associated protein FliL